MNPDLDPVARFFSFCNAAEAASSNGDYPAEVGYWSAAYQLVDEHQEAFRIQNLSVHDLRALVRTNWGNALANSGDFPGALPQFVTAWAIHEGELPNRPDLAAERAGLLMDWGSALYSGGDLPGALRQFAAVWAIHVQELPERPDLAADRATLLMNWGNALSSSGDLPGALLKLRAAWAIHEQELKDRPDLASNRARLLMNWGLALFRNGDLPGALRQYAAAWAIHVPELPERPDLAPDRAGLLMNWGAALYSSGDLPGALRQYKAAWDIHERELPDRPDLAAKRAGLLMNWGLALFRNGDLPGALRQYAAAWAIHEREFPDRPDLAADRAALLINWGVTLADCGDLPGALKQYAAALAIHEQELSDRPDLVANRALLLMNWGNALGRSGDLSGALRQYAAAWAIHEQELPDRPDMAAARAALLMSCGNALNSVGDLPGALRQYAAAWAIHEQELPNRPDLAANRARLLMNWGTALEISGDLPGALKQYAAALAIHEQELSDRPDLAANRALLLMNWGNALGRSGDLSGALRQYAAAWVIHEQELPERPDLAANRAKLLINWGTALADSGNLPGALRQYAATWAIYNNELLDRRETDPNLFNLALNELTCWSAMADPHNRAEAASLAMRERLNLIVETNRPHWTEELHVQFVEYHVRWMQRCLDAGKQDARELEHLPHILSLVSGWWLTQSLLDELDHANNAALPEQVKNYARLRNELHNLSLRIQQLAPPHHEMDSASPLNPDRQEKLNELRRQYDRTHGEMIAALQEAKDQPGYAALATDLGIDTEQLRQTLAADEAIALFVDFPHSDFHGVLLLSTTRLEWFPMTNPAQAMAYLNYFNETFCKGRSGVAFRGSNTVHADASADTTLNLSHTDFWPEFGQWVNAALWQPLAEALAGIRCLHLVTQGRAHSIPWEMEAPAGLVLKRYPGLALFAMQHNMIRSPKPDFTGEIRTLGLAASKDGKIPSAQREIEVIRALWAEKIDGRVVCPYDYLAPGTTKVEAVHLAGHGTHADDKPQSAELDMGGATSWGLPQIMASPARPRDVFISACVAGRTAEGEGDLYGTAAAMMQRGVRALTAATVNMHDDWMFVLGVLTQMYRLQEPHLTQGEALFKAKADLAQGIDLLPAIDNAWRKKHALTVTIPNVISDMIKDCNTADPAHHYTAVREKLSSFISYQDVLDMESPAFDVWLRSIMAIEPQQQKEYIKSHSVPWRKSPPQPYLGSLLHAVVHFGA
ncbi:MAG: CHAT domain-containing protein [Gallionella sp.]|nr:CHAT domain-containing protein [Gallionella sp.]